MKTRHKQAGFTIVELLIAIVVIAILAAISVVAYNGIQNRARASEASTALAQAKKKLELYKVDAGNYPSTDNLADAGVVEKDVSYQYTSDGSTYCITGTAGNVSYKASDTTNPTPGGCAGHGQGGVQPITNLAVNPSFETDIVGWTGFYSPTRTQSNERAKCGSYSQKVVTTSTTQANGTYSATTKTYTPGVILRASAWVWAPSSMPLRFGLRSNSGGLGSGGLATQAFTGNNAWQQVSLSYTVPSSPGSSYGPMINDVSLNSGEAFYVDCVMFSENDLPLVYVDPSISADWIWNGTPNNSTSTGPSS